MEKVCSAQNASWARFRRHSVESITVLDVTLQRTQHEIHKELRWRMG